jgi:hypothetical protein
VVLRRPRPRWHRGVRIRGRTRRRRRCR